MKLIKLTTDKYAKVDDEDFILLNQYKWWHHNMGYASGRVGKTGGKSILMHRFIMKFPKGKSIDHKDGDGLNNQKFNLRICSHKCNLSNQKKRENTSSIYKGVTKDNSRNCWIAQIKNNYKNIFLGRFKKEKDAAIAYDNAAVEYFGEFANLNFA